MTRNGWRDWWTKILAPAARRSAPLRRPAPRRQPAPRLEALEDRTLLASSITVIAGVFGSGTQDAVLLSQGGQIVFADPDLGANTVSTGALASLPPTADVRIEAAGPITINDLGGAFQLPTAAGHGVTFSTATVGGGAITFANVGNTLSTSGASLVFTAATSLSPANLDSLGGAITLAADAMNLPAGGTITSGAGRTTLRPNTPGTKIDVGGADAAGTLGLTNAELRTVTAGVLQVGDAASGDITVSAQINLTTADALSLRTNGVIFESVGDLKVRNLALRAAGDITATNTNGVDVLAAVSTTGAVMFTEGDGVTIGSVDGLDGVRTTDRTINVVAAVGGLTVADTPAAVDVGAGTGTVTLGAHGANQLLTLAAGAVVAGAGGVDLVGDNMTLLGNANASTAAATVGPFSPDAKILLGGANAPGVLGLDGASLNRVAAGVLRLGFANVGDVLVVAPIVLTSAPTLSITTRGTVAEPGGQLSVANLRVTAVGPISLNATTNNVGTLAAVVSGAGNGITYNEADFIDIGTVDGVDGLTTNNGPIGVVTQNGGVTVHDTPAANDVDAGTSTVLLSAGSVGNDRVLTVDAGVRVHGGGGVTLIADHLTLAGTVDAGASVATLKPFEAGTLVDVGGADAPNQLGLSLAKLARVTAGSFVLGSSTSGALTVSASVGPALTNTLTLVSGDGIGQTAGSLLSVPNLALQAAKAITLTEANGVTRLAANSGGGDVRFTNATALTVAGVSATDHAITLIATTGGLTVANTPAANDVDAGTGAVTLQAQGANQVLTVAAGAAVHGAGGVTYVADNMTLAGATNAGTATAALRQFTAGQLLDLGGADAAGTLGLTSAEINSVTAGIVKVGDVASGNISVTAALAPAGTAVLSLQTGGAVLDGTPTEQTDVTVPTLVIRAAAGVGGASDLNVAVTTLALANTASGSVLVTSAGGLMIGGGDGLSGVASAGAGNVILQSVGGPLVIDQAVSDTNGGGINFVTAGANGSIALTANGSVTAGGGSGGIAFNACAATSGGSVTLNNGPSAVDVSAAGTGAITVMAATSATVAANVVLQSGTTTAGSGGTITLESNCNTPAGTADVALGNGAQVLTNGGIVVTTDPDANGVGGIFTAGTGTALGAPGGGAAGNLSLTTAGDVTLGVQKAVGTLTLIAYGNLRDDGDDTTFVQGHDIVLSAKGAVGGDAKIGVADVLGQTAAFKAAVDFSLQGGTLTVNQTASGNVQLRSVGGPLATGRVVLGGAPTGTGKQLALLSSGGALTVDAALTVAAAANADLLLATTGNNNIQVRAAVTDAGASATTTLVAAGTGTITGPATADGVADVAGPSINLVTGGGKIGADAAHPLEVDAATLNAASANGDIFVTDTAGGVAVAGVSAGSGNVTLKTTGGALTSATGDGTADVVGSVVTLGATGGSVGGDATHPLEIDATTLNADVQGAGSLNVLDTAGGVSVALARTQNGSITLTAAGTGANLALTTVSAPSSPVVLSATGAITGTTGGTADVTGSVLSVLNGTGVGTAAAHLETAVGRLNANVGAGGLFVDNVGGLTFAAASGAGAVTSAGPVTVTTTAGLTVQDNVQATTGDVTLSALERSPAGSGDDVTVTAGKTVGAAGGNVSLLAGDTVTVAAGAVITASGSVLLNGGVNDNGDGGGVTLLGTATGAPVTVQGGTGGDTFTINTGGASPVTVQGLGGADTFNVTPSPTAAIAVDGGGQVGDQLNFDASGLVLRTTPGKLSATGRQTVSYSTVATTFVNNAATVNAFAGPDTADRGALAGLTASRRFVQALYLDVLGRAASAGELSFWAGQLNAQGTNGNAVVAAIEQSAEGRDRLVRSWYTSFLGRTANGTEELGWVNRLRGGDSEENVLGDILSTNEYLTKAGGSNGAFVRRLYGDLLGRTPNDGDVAFWSGLAAGAGRGAVAKAFLGSAEYRAYAVDSYFVTRLHRAAPPSVRDAFSASRLDLYSLRLVVESSAEFFGVG